MALTQESGPLVLTGQQPSQNGYTPDYNGDTAPSLSWGGMGFIDPRTGFNPGTQPGQVAAQGFVGGFIETLNCTPNASAVNNIAASAVPVAGTPMTLVSTTTSVVAKLTTAVVGLASKVAIPAGTLVLEMQPGTLATSGSATSSIQWYSAASNLARAVKVVSAGNDASGAFTVAGYDIYGYAMTEKITGGSGATVAGKKAFKFISSVTPSGTLSGSNVSVGTTDVIGLPVRSAAFAQTLIFYASALITATTGYLAYSNTAATSVTGDVRGTYAVQSATDGSKTLVVHQMVSPGMITLGSAGLFGPAQA